MFIWRLQFQIRLLSVKNTSIDMVLNPLQGTDKEPINKNSCLLFYRKMKVSHLLNCSIKAGSDPG